MQKNAINKAFYANWHTRSSVRRFFHKNYTFMKGDTFIFTTKNTAYLFKNDQ